MNSPEFPMLVIIGDNLDNYVKPRDMRLDAQASKLHCFNKYVIRDGLKSTCLSDSASTCDTDNIQVDQILPVPLDQHRLLSNFSMYAVF